MQDKEEQISKLKNALGGQLVNPKAREDIQVHIEIDNSLAPGLFKPHPQFHGVWYAHTQTYRAMKPDIFTIGDDLDEFKNEIQCHSCQKKVDTQFWKHCPYCESQFQK
jgi:hypothetical protein